MKENGDDKVCAMYNSSFVQVVSVLFLAKYLEL